MTALTAAEMRLGELTTAVAEVRARRQSTEAQLRERQERVHKLERQLAGLEAQTREIVGRAPDASKLKVTAEAGQAHGRHCGNRGGDARCRGGRYKPQPPEQR